jgi:hypothetical protein
LDVGVVEGVVEELLGWVGANMTYLKMRDRDQFSTTIQQRIAQFLGDKKLGFSLPTRCLHERAKVR